MFNLSCPINNLSYGLVGLNIVSSLDKMGSDFFLNPIGQVDVPTDFSVDTIKKHMGLNPYKNSSSVRIYHQFSLIEHVGKGKHIGFPIFELDSFSPLEIKNLSYCDEIFVCSDWAKKVILDKKELQQKNVVVVPLGVDREVFNEHNPFIKPKKTIFLNIGKMEYRKGHDILPEIFSRAFNHNDDYELWMMADSCFNDKVMYETMKREYHQKLAGRVRFLSSVKSSLQVANIIKKSDCGIFPTRAEGFCMPLLECLSCGIMCISTGYSGQTQFANQLNCNLVEITETEKAVDNIWFHGQGNWAKISDDQLDEFIYYVRKIHQEKQAQNLPINEEGVATAKKFSWDNSSRTILTSL